MIDPSVHNIGRGIHKDIQYPGKGPLPNYQKDTKVHILSLFRRLVTEGSKILRVVSNMLSSSKPPQF